jgi:hypothetical protein
MIAILNSLVPIFLVIALGTLIKRFDFPGEGLWQPLDRLTYYVFFPALLLHTLATADLTTFDVWPMAYTLWAGLFTMVALLMLLRATSNLSGPQFASVFQGAARWNGFVALAAIGQLFGPEGVTLAAVAFATLVPTVNVLSVTILTRYAGDEPAGLGTVLRLISKNPLILACAAGIFLNITGLRLPGPLAPTADILGQAALTLGLLAIGSGLRLDHAYQTKGIVLLTSTLKLIVMPLLLLGWCWVFDIEGLPRLVILLCGTVPGATSSYILAKQLGGDATLMASLITGSTIFAAFTMPLMLYLFT